MIYPNSSRARSCSPRSQSQPNTASTAVAAWYCPGVEPWGTVLCRADAGETTLLADLDMERVDAVRAQLPILKSRRTDLYEIGER